MTDQELSRLMQEWKDTPAPPTLNERVFEPRSVPAPFWDRVPALALAGAGAVLGFLLVLGLSSFAPQEPVASTPAPQTAPAPPAEPAHETASRASRPEPPQSAPVKAKVKMAIPKTSQAAPPPPPPRPTAPANPASARPVTTRQPQPIFPDNLPIELSYTVTILRVRVAKDGSVLEAEVLEGAPELNEVALEAVRQWHLEPRRLNDEPVEFETRVEVKFSRPVPTKGKAVPRAR